MPTLTVLMPVYNSAKFLDQAIESILNQSLKDFEFIIIDDCSTDNSVAIIEGYNDTRIRFYKNESNLGISATLNKGIELANSEWIARMDSDDISYPDRLQRQYDFISQHPEGALFSCWARVIDQEGRFVRQDNFRSEYYYYNLTFICWIYHPTVIYRKTAVKEVGMYSVPYAEDFELFWQLSRKYKIYNIAEVLLDYRVTDQSLHQVLRKNEYRHAQMDQLLRNFRFFAGNNYFLPQSYIDCLQHNFQPLLAENSVAKIISCIYELDFLTDCILKKENVNRDVEAIKAAAFYKRRFIISFFADNLPVYKSVLLLARLKCFKMLRQLIIEQIHLKHKIKFCY
jgi:glycosyltransferase involved in cell wall biosynthesis